MIEIVFLLLIIAAIAVTILTKKKRNISIQSILSTWAIALSTTACIITWLRIEIYTTNDTFVGIMAGFMGACATLIVGVQIYNSIETKNKLRDIEKLQVELKSELLKSQSERERSEGKVQSYLHRTHGISLAEQQPLTAFELLFKSLEEALKFGTPEEIKKVLHDLKAISNKTKIRKDAKEKMNFTFTIPLDKMKPDVLEEHKLYPLIKDEYIKIYNTMKDVMTGLKIKQIG